MQQTCSPVDEFVKKCLALKEQRGNVSSTNVLMELQSVYSRIYKMQEPQASICLVSAWPSKVD